MNAITRLTPGTWIEVRDPQRRVSYGLNGLGLFQVVKVGRVNVRCSSDIRFRPDGPVYHHEHVIPLSHVVRIVRPDEIAPLDKQAPSDVRCAQRKSKK